MRALLPATTLAPVAAGLVVIVGARYNVFSLEVAIGILVIVVALILRTVLFRTVRAVEASDRARSQAADEARRSTAEAGRSADEARRVDERTRTIMATITDTIVTIDASSRILFVNPAVERMFGYPVSELLGRQLTVLMPERFRSRHEAGLRRYIESGERGIDWDGAELVGLGRDGVEFPIDVSFAEDASGGFETFTGTIRDVTARKRLETQLLQAQRLESVGRLAGGIAHDFNNVLTAIGGFAQLLLADVPPGGPASGKIRVITDATNRASALVRQLLAFSRQQILRPEVLELGDVVRGVTPMLERLIGEDIEVAVGLVEDGWPVDADRGQLEQVIVNLVVNARDAMPSGGRLTIETANVDLDEDYVETHPEVTPGPHAMLAVSDTGLGMDAATRTQIFEPFFTTKDPGSGTGLGLATVYGIVRQSGGHIWVYSEPDRGTTFRLYFPRAAGAPARLVAESRRPVSSGGAETILVTEDESTLRELVRVVLGRLGYRVLLAADAASALEIARSERIDLLVTDVVLPGRSGLELAEAMRADAAGLRVLYMSGYTAAALEDQGRFRGDVELLEKPFTPETLGVAVRRALDRQ
jgi:PAS domain S-box-containing protein